MKFQIKLFLSGLLILASFAALKAQVSNTAPATNDEDEIGCGLVTDLVNFNFLVWSSKKGHLNDLTAKDFVVFDDKEKQEIEFFQFDKSTNQYSIAFSPQDFIVHNQWHEVKIEVKLTAEKMKETGKILVIGQNGYFSNRF